mmetsp:Transcript_300/g.648  ORF Transcript_300/g.648 Transcript_300/m.648 type:complete len:306 (-) Transcript_300:711-1628(-)
MLEGIGVLSRLFESLGGINFGQENHIGDSHINFSWIVVFLICWTKRVDESNIKVRLVKAAIIIAAVPQDDIGFLFGLVENHFIVDAGKEKRTVTNVTKVLFPFLNGALVLVHIRFRFVTLASLTQQVLIIRHGVTNRCHLQTLALEVSRNVSRCLTLADACTRGAHGHDGLGGFHHGHMGRQLHKLASRRINTSRELLNGIVLEIGIRQGTGIGTRPGNDIFEFIFGENVKPVGILVSIYVIVTQFGRKVAFVNAGNLGGSKCHDFDLGLFRPSVHKIKEVATGRTQNNYFFTGLGSQGTHLGRR